MQTSRELSEAKGALGELIQEYRFEEPIFVTRPTMPRLEDYVGQLRRIWESRWLTNAGPLHDELEQALRFPGSQRIFYIKYALQNRM